MKMFWAYGDRDVAQLDRIKFKAKGLKTMFLLNPTSNKPKEASLMHWDVTMKEVYNK